jgi:hypothetical protein
MEGTYKIHQADNGTGGYVVIHKFYDADTRSDSSVYATLHTVNSDSEFTLEADPENEGHYYIKVESGAEAGSYLASGDDDANGDAEGTYFVHATSDESEMCSWVVEEDGNGHYCIYNEDEDGTKYYLTSAAGSSLKRDETSFYLYVAEESMDQGGFTWDLEQ